MIMMLRRNHATHLERLYAITAVDRNSEAQLGTAWKSSHKVQRSLTLKRFPLIGEWMFRLMFFKKRRLHASKSTQMHA